MQGIIVQLFNCFIATSPPPSPKRRGNRRGNNLTIEQCSNRKPRGFTLIELLVVITLVGILGTFVFINVDSYLKKAKDAERINSLKQLQTALELYYQDNRQYPKTDSVGGIMWRSGRTGGRWIPELTEKYIPEIPIDPKNGSGCSQDTTDGVRDGGDFCYDLAYYSADIICNLTGQGYILATRLEATDTTKFSQKNIIDPTTGQVCAASPTWSESPTSSLYVLVNP